MVAAFPSSLNGELPGRFCGDGSPTAEALITMCSTQMGRGGRSVALLVALLVAVCIFVRVTW